jgi:predicted lipoprotein with Yx(FWY)xxD motif
MSRKYFAMVLALPLLLAGCANDGEPGAEPASPTVEAGTETGTDTGTGTETGAADAVTVELAEAGDLGEVLVDGEGMTLYMFDPDAQGESTCYDECEESWPPLVTDGEAGAGEGVDDSKLRTVERTDGSQQVTYNDWPLYYFGADEAAGDVAGQGVNGVWWVLNADGEPVRGTTGTGGLDY